MKWCWVTGRPTVDGSRVFELFSGMTCVACFSLNHRRHYDDDDEECTANHRGRCDLSIESLREFIRAAPGLTPDERVKLRACCNRPNIDEVLWEWLDPDQAVDTPKGFLPGDERLLWQRYHSRRRAARLATMTDEQIKFLDVVRLIGGGQGGLLSKTFSRARARARKKLRDYWRRAAKG